MAQHLRRWLEEGLTHQAMADRTFEVTGERVSRAAITMALQRYNLVDQQRPRYEHEVPWRVKVEHLRAYPVRMLRTLGRRNSGEPMSAEMSARLDGWLKQLEEANAVVGYDPDSDEGFHYIAREPGDPEGVPIRVRRIWVDPPTM